MSLTLKQGRDYIYGILNELDQEKIATGLLNQYLVFAQRKVQTDLMPILGMKYFTKKVILTGTLATLPADFIQVDNSPIDLNCSTGTVRAFVSDDYTVPTAHIIHTSVQPGIPGNSLSLTVGSGIYGTPPALTILCTYIGGNFFIDFAAGMTCTQIVNAFNLDPVYSQFLICSTSTGSAVPVPHSLSLPLATGAGTGWFPAQEWIIKEANRLGNDSYRLATNTSPKFVRNGNGSGIQYLSLYPSGITYSQLFYNYLVADLSADTDPLTIPAQFEEYVLIDALSRTYKTLKDKAASQQEALTYEAKLKELQTKYDFQFPEQAKQRAQQGGTN